MIKQSIEAVEKYSLNKVSNYYYKVLLRDNIEEKNNTYTVPFTRRLRQRKKPVSARASQCFCIGAL